MSTVTSAFGSSRRLDEARAELIDRVVSAFNPDQQVVAASYFELLAADDIVVRSANDFIEIISAHLALGQNRTAQSAEVRAFTPGDEFAHSVVQVVTDDMPFLVDSVTAELTRLGSGIHVLYHPRFAVVRSATGDLEQIADSKSENGQIESWICVEITRETDEQDLRNIEAAIQRVLADVRAAVTDWPEMRSRAFELASVLRSTNKADDTSAVDFLNWLVADHFTFVGYAHYRVANGELILDAGSELGTLRSAGVSDPLEGITLARLGTETDNSIMLVTKANTRSTVHRPSYLDYVGVREFDGEGNITGVHRFIGLLTASAYTSSISTVPLISQKAAAVVAELGLGQNTHSGKDLQQFLETYPRDDMFQISVAELTAIAREALRLQERRQVRAFMRVDNFSRFASFLVYFPRDRYTTAVRVRMEEILQTELGAASVDHAARVSESALARLHFVVHMPSGVVVPDVDLEHIENLLAQATRSWDDDFATALVVALGEERALPLLRKWVSAIPESFKEDVSAEYAPEHIAVLEELQSLENGEIKVRMYEPQDEADGTRRFTIYRAGEAITLSSVLPMLHDLGVTVIDERAYDLRVAGAPVTWIYDFGLSFSTDGIPGLDSLADRFCESFLSTWHGTTDSDGFNALVLHAGLSARNAAVIRAYAAYLRQAGTPFSQGYLQQVLLAHVDVVQLLAKLFAVRFDTKLDLDREQQAQVLVEQINGALDAVASLDHDRILRSCVALVTATLRTNVYQKQADGEYQQVMAFKLDPSAVPELPLPLPKFEVWVYSPRVEGVHLRFAAVARGGLRWSDRLEDFRTEILGLVKAQMVKNTVIVPSGAKGGFVVKRGPEPSDRDAWLAEGIACYQAFIGALLDVTDNLVKGEVVPPVDVIRHDSDDPYLVVAADKGTATFSDIANQISLDRGFWMGDAFASGGSVGYDHKGMGITARGAWESVKRHFLELGHDTQTQDFTAVGIGDMSGDVFGNGMLLSEHLRLVAAFDHRHIFLDPNPDAATSYVERRRLFDLPRSSWADYNLDLISAGGGIHPRTAKSIEITPEVRVALGLADDVTALKPYELQAAILQAPVDLLWNGGIGTYLKSKTETNAQVGDKANDALRIDGATLRAKVFGEGGNLGATQLGRIEAALNGVRLNTDAIDNSAGVDTSDHEVNIKILLDSAIASGELAASERTSLLESMTDEVGQLVLRDNYNQNLILEQSRYQAPVMLSVHQRLLHVLEAEANLNRAVEFLPDDATLATRSGIGLTSPELSVLMAYEKIRLANYRSADGLLEEPWCGPILRGYFPKVLGEKFGDLMERHPLRSEIISTVIVNDIVNRGGITFVMRAAEETGAGISEIARAYIVVREVFGFAQIWQQIEDLDGVVDTKTQANLFLEMRRLLDRATRWFLHTRGGRLDVLGEQTRFAASIKELAPTIPGLLRGAEAARFSEHQNRLVEAGVPAQLSATVASALDVFSLLDIVEIATKTNRAPADVAKLYFAVSEQFEVDRLLVRITGLERSDRWSAHARSALRSDLYAALAALVLQMITYPGDWEVDNSEGVARTRAMLSEIVSDDQVGLANLSVALRAIRTLVG